MRNSLLFLGVFFVGFSAQGAIARGGFGLLFPDNNSLTNVGHTATHAGFAAEVLFAKFTGTHELSLSPSVAWASGTAAIAAFGTRQGKSLGDSSQWEENFGAGAGLAFAKGTWTVGLAVERTADPHKTIARGPTDSTADLTVGFHPGSTWSFGVSGGSTLGRAGGEAPRGSAAVGWRASPAVKLEAVAAFPNLKETGQGQYGVFGAWEGNRFYTAGGLSYLAALSAPQILARFGVIFGAVDLSFFVTYVVKTAENPFHGAALRVAF